MNSSYLDIVLNLLHFSSRRNCTKDNDSLWLTFTTIFYFTFFSTLICVLIWNKGSSVSLNLAHLITEILKGWAGFSRHRLFLCFSSFHYSWCFCTVWAMFFPVLHCRTGQNSSLIFFFFFNSYSIFLFSFSLGSFMVLGERETLYPLELWRAK